MGKILVIGDIMLDRYRYGEATRISPEAPVPVLLEDKERYYSVPGGAANVAMNIAGGGGDVGVFSIVGNDFSGKELLSLLDKNNIDTSFVIKSTDRITTLKTRFIAQNNQQIMRVDDEMTEEVPFEALQEMVRRIEKRIEDFSIFVLSDYNKGFLSEIIIDEIRRIALKARIKVIADVKGRNSNKYRELFLVKPNRKELEDLTGKKALSLKEVSENAVSFCKDYNVAYCVVTCGKDGMLLADRNRKLLELKSDVKEVFDVTGAGDTVLAYIAVGLASGNSVDAALIKSNIAAGIQVSKFGTSPVYEHEVNQFEIKETNSYSRKIIDLDTVKKILNHNHKKVVFTNGCFDILHIGHITYLNKAARLGDLLIVGINSDASVKRLKGSNRPINNIGQRAAVLSSLEFVDYVIVFDEDKPTRLISEIKPDVLVKGADYAKKEIVGWDIVEAYGGEVKTIDLVNGVSTTNIIQKIEEDSERL